MGWVTKETARLDEMGHGKISLHLEVHQDGDVILSIREDGIEIQDKNGNTARVEFCSTAGGGGRSPSVRRALGELIKAIEEDNKRDSEGIPPYPIYLREKS